MESKLYVAMPPHSRCNVNGKMYDIISCRTITTKMAERLIDSEEFTNGIDREQLRRAGIEDTSTWWYNHIEDMIMIKGRTGRYYIKKIRQVSNSVLSQAYQIACDNYAVIAQYVQRHKRI